MLLFDVYKFPNLLDFSLQCSFKKRLRKEFLTGFPALRRLKISCSIEVIEHDSFSNIQQLCFLDLSGNKPQ